MYCVATVIALISALELAFLIPLSNANCSIDIRQDLAKNDPIFFSLANKNELLVPHNGSLSFPANGGAVITCSGTGMDANNNFIVLGTRVTNQHSTRITCLSGNTFRSDLDPTKTFHANELSCKNKNAGSVEITKIPCAELGKLVHIGFRNIESKLVPFIKVCYDFRNDSAIYSQHVVYGAAIKNAVDAERFSFRKTFENISKESYTKEKEISQFTNLLGSAELAANYVDTSSSSQKYLARGHLTPDADGIFASWQHSTYYYANVVPQWQTVNNGNWKRIENVVRLYADKKQENLQIFTGTYGTLQLKNTNNRLQSITLEANRIRVPKWLWKVVKSTKTNAAIAFVTLNNATKSPDTRLLCTDICASTNWAQTQFSNARNGFTYCCNVNDLTELEDILPAGAFAPKILSYEEAVQSPKPRKKTAAAGA